MPSSRKPNRQSTQRPTRSQPNAASRRPPGPRSAAAPRPGAAPELVDPRWLLKALALVFAVALLCAWGTLWLLYYQGQWQLVLHPSRTVATTPASLGLKFTPLRFAVDATGVPQLDGWLIPASGNTATPTAPTALFLHSADGSIGARGPNPTAPDSTALDKALILHNAGLNVLLFDYRGYGRSTGRHPSETSMQQDAEAALNYLVSTQHIPPQNIVIYGNGIGASLAVQLAAQHPDVSSIILDAPDGDLLDRASRDARSRLVPTRLLFNERFPLAEPLRTLNTPKLLIAYNTSTQAPAFVNAANPKTTVELPSSTDPALTPAIRRFVDLYVTRPTH